MIYKLSNFVRATSSLRPKILKEIYHTVTEKIIPYGSEIWYNNNVKQKVKLIKMQGSSLLLQ